MLKAAKCWNAISFPFLFEHACTFSFSVWLVMCTRLEAYVFLLSSFCEQSCSFPMWSNKHQQDSLVIFIVGLVLQPQRLGTNQLFCVCMCVCSCIQVCVLSHKMHSNSFHKKLSGLLCWNTSVWL